MSYVLETKNLTKKYNGMFAVKDVNMHIEEGDIYGFVGENGAGKTTIMRLITGLSLPTSGSFDLFGVDSNSNNINTVKKQLGGIVENVTFTKNMTALDNLIMQCIMTNTKKTVEELNNLLEKVGLDSKGIEKRKVGNFSLGMRQRLGIAMILINSPKFILLDEPMNGLDPQGIIEMREMILNLNKEGITFFISSHILSELDKIANRVGFISHGKMLEELSIEELHQKARKKIVLEVNDFSLLKVVFDELLVKDYEVNNNTITIFDEIDVNLLMKKLVDNNILVDKINMVEDTIENYYINLIMRG